MTLSWSAPANCNHIVSSSVCLGLFLICFGSFFLYSAHNRTGRPLHNSYPQRRLSWALLREREMRTLGEHSSPKRSWFAQRILQNIQKSWESLLKFFNFKVLSQKRYWKITAAWFVRLFRSFGSFACPLHFNGTVHKSQSENESRSKRDGERETENERQRGSVTVIHRIRRSDCVMNFNLRMQSSLLAVLAFATQRRLCGLPVLSNRMVLVWSSDSASSPG